MKPVELPITEFYLLWFEDNQQWVVCLPNGFLRGYPSQGHAMQAALKHLGRAEAEFLYEDFGGGNIYAYKDDEFWGKV